MPDILHRVGIDAQPAVVVKALTTVEGLRDWWTQETSGNCSLNGVIDFGFCRMKVIEYIPERLVRWQCVSGPNEWVDTQVSFQLSYKDKQTFILFSHTGWREPVEFMHHCSTKWAVFLMSLKSLIEQGQGNPAPHDVKIHVGD